MNTETTKSNLQHELIERVVKLEKEKIKHKKAFDQACKDACKENPKPKRRIFFLPVWRMTFSFMFLNNEDLKKVLEARIIAINSEIEETIRLINQL